MLQSFALFLKEHNIISQYIMSSKHNINRVVEKLSIMFKEMMRALLNSINFNVLWSFKDSYIYPK